MWKFLSGAVAGAFLGSAICLLFFGSRPPADCQAGSLGAYDMGRENENLKWRSPSGGDRQATITRNILKVPEHYGTLVEIQGGEMWFKEKCLFQ